MSVAIGKEAVEVGGILSQFSDVCAFPEEDAASGSFFVGNDQTGFHGNKFVFTVTNSWSPIPDTTDELSTKFSLLVRNKSSTVPSALNLVFIRLSAR